MCGWCGSTLDREPVPLGQLDVGQRFQLDGDKGSVVGPGENGGVVVDLSGQARKRAERVEWSRHVRVTPTRKGAK